jgi:hypothetical protein
MSFSGTGTDGALEGKPKKKRVYTAEQMANKAAYHRAWRLKNHALNRSYAKKAYYKDVEASRTRNRERLRVLRAKNPRAFRGYNLKSHFGITADQYDEMHTKQGGVCFICKRPERTKKGGSTIRLAVDHCHATGAVRDLLCSDCNQAIGRVYDSPERARQIADYLERHGRCADGSIAQKTNHTN